MDELLKGSQNIIGERVRFARQKASSPITQEDLAARLQIEGLDYMDQEKISRIESGKRPVYDYEVVALARCLHVSLEWLLNEE